jgi:UDPglucose 6-dehydrogenase
MIGAVEAVNALILLTEWRQFRQADFAEVKRRMLQPIIFDGRNQYDPEHMSGYGFEYYCIGRNCYVK